MNKLSMKISNKPLLFLKSKFTIVNNPPNNPHTIFINNDSNNSSTISPTTHNPQKQIISLTRNIRPPLQTKPLEPEPDEDFKTHEDYIKNLIRNINKTELNLPLLPIKAIKSNNQSQNISRNQTDRDGHHVKISNQMLQQVLSSNYSPKNNSIHQLVVGNRNKMNKYNIRSYFGNYSTGVSGLKSDNKSNSLLVNSNHQMYYNRKDKKLSHVKEMFRKALLCSMNGIKCPII